MREGYKETAVGWIPEEWEDALLMETGEIVSGGTPDTENPDYWNGHIAWCTPTDVTSLKGNRHINKTSRYISIEGLRNSSANLLPERSLVICTRATIGDCAINIIPISTNQGFKSIVPGKNWDVNFLYYFILANKPKLVKLSSGSTFLEISKAAFEKIPIPKPNKAEQSKIASILSTVDDKIDSINKRIEETRKLKQGLMQRLLTQGIGHTKFKDSPLGRIPEGWEVVRICDIAEVKGGKRLPKGESLVEQQTPYPYIRVSDMFMGGINPINILYVPESIQKTIRRYTIGKDDLFISVAGTLGLVGKIPPELDGANLTENADKLTNIKCNRSYLLQVLMSNIIQNSIQNESTSNAQPKLALTRIQQFEIPLPSLPEQSKIASILSSTDMKVENLTRINSEYEQLKKSLMQQLLTGRMRVIANRSSKYI